MSHSRNETRVVPDQVFTLAPATNLEVHPLRAQHMHTVFVARRDIDLGSLVELGHIMDPVFECAVAAHVVNHAPADRN